jgi:uridine kinase
MTLNILQNNEEFDKKIDQEKWEVEKKFAPIDPHYFDFLESICEIQHIEQIYLSMPEEPYSLRVRKIDEPDGTVHYTATLKSQGTVETNGLTRFETPTEISAETFAYYEKTDLPRLKKHRAEPAFGVTIDWIEGYDRPIIEIEDLAINKDAQLFFLQYSDAMNDYTGLPEVDNEWIAHQLATVERSQIHEISIADIADKVLGYKQYGVSPIIVTIDGRSGSGKSTYARQLADLLKLEKDGQSLETIVLSTDNYHRGKSWLEAHNNGLPWQNWDASIVFNTKELATDVTQLRAGESIENRFFSFNDQECHFEGTIRPAEVIIIEGIYAGTKDLEGIRHFHFPVQTPLATSIGRDLDRLSQSDRPNSAIGSRAKRLAHQLTYAEPAFQEIERVSKRSLKAYRHKVGNEVLQVRNGEVVTG